MKIKGIKQCKKLFAKKILLRLDLNVPIANGHILDDYKLQRSLDTLFFLIKQGAKIIIISHLGRPKGEYKKSLSLLPIARRLEELLNKKVNFAKDCIGFDAGTKVAKMKESDVLMLENLRFEIGEEKNSFVFARHLAKMANIYVNDAFGVSHRKQASVSAIKEYLPAYAGLLLEKEVKNLNKVLTAQKNAVALIGGAKMNTKIALLKKLNKKSYKILLGGALANNFLVAHNLEIGKSFFSEKSVKMARRLKNKNIVLPLDVLVSSKKEKWQAKVKKVTDIAKDEYIFDIGPETIRFYSSLLKKADTIIWNGPMGVFEEDQYKYGTLYLARVIASRSKGRAFGVAGGGETVSALKMTKMEKYIDWVSTGGGAMLSFLGGEKMPGLEKIVKKS